MWVCNECDSEPSDDDDGYCTQCREKIEEQHHREVARRVNTIFHVLGKLNRSQTTTTPTFSPHPDHTSPMTVGPEAFFGEPEEDIDA